MGLFIPPLNMERLKRKKRPFFKDFTQDTFSDFIKDVEQIRIEEEWLTDDVRPGREKEKWLNLILKKTGF